MYGRIMLENVRLSRQTYGDFEHYMKVSLGSACSTLTGIMGRMVKEKREGRVVFVLSSCCTQSIPPEFMSPYVTFKCALLGLMRTLATEYDSKSITINGVAHGIMETTFLEKIYEHAYRRKCCKASVWQESVSR